MPKCFAQGCPRATIATQFMCRAHWYAIPRDIRNRVNHAHKACVRARKRHIEDRDWLVAAYEAKLAVAQTEGWPAEALEQIAQRRDRAKERNGDNHA